MKPSEEFKIGDKVKVILKGHCSNKIGIITDNLIVNDKIIQYVDNDIGYVNENILELVSTSEELAVDKFKEELKDKINKKIKENIDNNIINFETLTKKEILELLK